MRKSGFYGGGLWESAPGAHKILPSRKATSAPAENFSQDVKSQIKLENYAPELCPAVLLGVPFMSATLEGGAAV